MQLRETPYGFVPLCIFLLSQSLPLMCITNLLLLPCACVRSYLVSYSSKVLSTWGEGRANINCRFMLLISECERIR